MSQLTWCTVLLLVVHSTISITLDLVVTPGSGEINRCPAQEEMNAVIQTLETSVRTIVQNLEYNSNCGPGLCMVSCGVPQLTSVIPHSSVHLPGESTTLME